jgi:hypothetical protein
MVMVMHPQHSCSLTNIGRQAFRRGTQFRLNRLDAIKEMAQANALSATDRHQQPPARNEEDFVKFFGKISAKIRIRVILYRLAIQPDALLACKTSDCAEAVLGVKDQVSRHKAVIVAQHWQPSRRKHLRWF